ncbi:MAG: folate hydrolase, partial [Bacteroidota bacterium]|nr:folate hydrolase [Bacteroidota bacterium]
MNKALLTALTIFLFQFSFAQSKKITGFYEKNIDKQLNLESSFDKNLSIENIGDNMKKLSAKPHHISSPGSKENAEYILSLYKKWGWDAQIETFHVLFPTPKTRELEMVSPIDFASSSIAAWPLV